MTPRASLISSTLTKCPNTKIVMSGYSQGGQLVHKAAASLPAATMARVSCVVIFGDPSEYTQLSHCTKLSNRDSQISVRQFQVPQHQRPWLSATQMTIFASMATWSQFRILHIQRKLGKLPLLRPQLLVWRWETDVEGIICRGALKGCMLGVLERVFGKY